MVTNLWPVRRKHFCQLVFIVHHSNSNPKHIFDENVDYEANDISRTIKVTHGRNYLVL